MNIDSQYKTVNVSNHPFFTEPMYCFCTINSSNRDWYGNIEIDIKNNAISVYWTEEQIKQFRPNDGSHNYTRTLNSEFLADRLKGYKKRLTGVNKTIKLFESGKHMNSTYEHWKAEKRKLENLIFRMKFESVIFVKIN